MELFTLQYSGPLARTQFVQIPLIPSGTVSE